MTVWVGSPVFRSIGSDDFVEATAWSAGRPSWSTLFRIIGIGSSPSVQDMRDAYFHDGYVYAGGAGTTAGDGLVIWDVRDPENPAIASEIGNDLSFARGVVVRDGIAYVAGRDSGSLVTFDVSDPKKPIHLDSYVSSSIDGARGVAIQGDYVFVGMGYLGSSGQTGIAIFDISDPSEIQLVSRLSADDDADIDRVGTVLVDGGNLYASGYFDGTLMVFDVTDPESPSLRSKLSSPELDSTRGLSKMGDVLFVSCAGGGGAIVAVNVSDPKNPIQISALQDPRLNGARGNTLLASRLFVSCRNTGLVALVDVNDPANMHIVETYAHPSLTGAYGITSGDGRVYAVSAGAGDLVILGRSF